MRRSVLISILLLIAAILILPSCAGTEVPQPYHFLGTKYFPRVQRLLGETDYSGRYVIMEDLIENIYKEKGIDDLRSFINQYTISAPADPYNAYYLLLLGDYYRENQSVLSEYYYSKLLEDYPDVIVGGYSTHYQAINGLLNQVNDPGRRISYYRTLLTDFSDVIDPGLNWYRLAQEYRRDGRFDDYYDALEKFSRYPDTVVPGIPDIQQRVREELAFHFNNAKDWTSPSLDTLVSNIKSALYSRSASRLERYRAKENFFAMAWLQETGDFNATRGAKIDIGRFLANARRIYYLSDFTIINDKEAYLKTWGWSYRIPEWYFYFRKIDYPADPEINGNWEWAGIFFGNTL